MSLPHAGIVIIILMNALKQFGELLPRCRVQRDKFSNPDEAQKQFKCKKINKLG